MSRHKQFVTISNPMPGGACYTSMKSAKKYEARGIVEFTSTTEIRFVRGVAATHKANRLTPSQIGYDQNTGNGLASLTQVKNLPVVSDPVKGFTIPSVKSIKRFKRTYPVRHGASVAALRYSLKAISAERDLPAPRFWKKKRAA